jgi:hypothetical protein
MICRDGGVRLPPLLGNKIDIRSCFHPRARIDRQEHPFSQWTEKAGQLNGGIESDLYCIASMLPRISMLSKVSICPR